MVGVGRSVEDAIALQRAYNSNICFSGGATGADKLWGEVAAKHGHKVCHFTFEGHHAAKWAHGRELNQHSLDEANDRLTLANLMLRRPDPLTRDSTFVQNLLKRNYWQIRDTDAVYAIANLDGIWKVQGGTAWAVQMFIDRMTLKFRDGDSWYERNQIPLYTFDQEVQKWYQYCIGIGFQQMEGKPPAPKGKWTGIGSRPKNLTEAGIKAIETIFD